MLLPTRNSSHAKYRPDIDGLRAIAVLSVVIFHAFPNLIKGGFIGVDVFFVISGYLISTVIFENLAKGTFSLTQFYGRRIRRIFPALIIVMVACFAFGWFALLADEFKQLSKHIAAGAGFVSNIVFWKESGYFDTAAETKPLLHLWTLGIEEQFYIVWPLILWLAWKKKLNILAITIFVAVASFTLNIKEIKVDAVGTFFSPLTRFWELLSGSLLAWFTINHKNTLSSFRASIVSFVGISLLFCGFWRINQDTVFPGVWALVPVLGAVLIISAGSQAWVNRTVLSNKVAVWIGLISFPLYLWHWPLLTFARIVEGEVPSRNIRLAAATLSVVLAWLTYKFVECPIRLGKHSYAKTIALVILMVLLGFGGYNSYKNNRVSGGATKVESLSRQIGWTIPASSQQQVDSCKKMFPDRILLTPLERDDNFCILQRESTPNVLMIGDSLNLSLFPGLNKYTDINVLVLSASSAAPLYNIRTVSFNDTIRLFNYKLTNQALDYAFNNDEIKVVVLSFSNGPFLANTNSKYTITNILNPNDKDHRRIFTEALSSTLSRLLSKNKRIIYVLPNPSLSYDIKSCLNSYRPFRLTKGTNMPCAQSSTTYLENGGREYRDWVASVLKDFPEVRIFDAADPFCDKDKCWGMKDGKVLYRDEAHLSIEGSELVSPFLVSLIREALNSN